MIWLAFTYLAFRRDRPILRLCWVILVITPLPVEFLEGRGEAVLAVPLIGVAIFAAVVFTDFAWTVADAFKGEPIFVVSAATAGSAASSRRACCYSPPAIRP